MQARQKGPSMRASSARHRSATLVRQGAAETGSSDASTNRHLRAAASGGCHITAGQAVRQGIPSHCQLHPSTADI
eukprot:5514717-Prymnesium_polylepis.1